MAEGLRWIPVWKDFLDFEEGKKYVWQQGPSEGRPSKDDKELEDSQIEESCEENEL